MIEEQTEKTSAVEALERLNLDSLRVALQLFTEVSLSVCAAAHMRTQPQCCLHELHEQHCNEDL